MFSPNAFMIGAAKSATSSLAHWLSQHQDVYLIKGKESNFWRRDYYRGIEWYNKEHIVGYSGEKYILDASTINQVLHYSPERILQMSKNPKIIMCIRDPIDRAYSHWRMLSSWRPGRVHKFFNDAMIANIKAFNPNKFMLESDFVPYLEPKGECYKDSFIEQGLYGHNLSFYYDIYDDIELVSYDVITRDSSAAWAQVCNYLQIPQLSVPLEVYDPNTKIPGYEDYYNHMDQNILVDLIGCHYIDLQLLDSMFATDYAKSFFAKWSARI